MTEYQSFVSASREWIASLKREIELKKKKIRELEEFIKSNEEDEKNEANQEEIHHYSSIHIGFPVYLSQKSIDLFRTIENEGKRIDVILRELNRDRVVLKKESLYVKLAYYKKNFGFVESTPPGLYKLSERGRKYLNTKYPKSSTAFSTDKRMESAKNECRVVPNSSAGELRSAE